MTGKIPTGPAPDQQTLLAIIDRADSAFWIYDVDRCRVIWSNRAGLKTWDAHDLQELQSRDMAADMSQSVRLRLRQYQEDFEKRDAEFYESWTLYPKGTPKTLRVKYSGLKLADGRMAMLCQAIEPEKASPEAIRSIEALLHTSVMISMIARDGSLLYCNPAARACQPRNGGRFADRFVDRNDYARLLKTVAKDGRCDMIVRVRGNPAPCWHQIHAFQCLDAVTGDRAILVSESDVTETQEAKAELEVSRNQALEANRLKSEFLANMSHEIRTPLNGVLGMAQLLKRTETTQQQARMVETILASGETLLSLISDILDITRIEAGSVEVKNEPYSVETLLASTVAAVEGAANVKGLKVESECALDGAAMQTGDADLIHQVLVNLTGNAIKFSDDGTVRVSVRCAAPGRLRFTVADEGPGIPPEQQGIIFEPFRQADGSARRHHGGTGLGLSIAKKLVERMRGEIGVDSRLGQGTAFWFELPSRVAAPEADEDTRLPISEEQQEAPAGGEARVLVVEDNKANRDIVCEILRMMKYSVVSASSGREALKLIEETPFDLALLDLHMPEMTGAQILSTIRARNWPPRDMPVIVTTADVTPEARICCLEAGATAFLTKPIRIEELLDLVAKLLNDRSSSPALA